MRLAARPAAERRLLAALDAVPPRLPVVVGGCGGGRTSLLQRLRARLGPGTVLVDLERVATTPERCLSSVLAALPGPAAPPVGGEPVPGAPRAAFDRLCHLFAVARGADGGPVAFLIDEMLEIRTFESFPGLRSAFAMFRQSLCDSPNRFVLTTRFTARTVRLFRDAPGPFEFVHLPPLTPAEVRAALADLGLDGADHRSDTAGLVHALTGGRPRYVRLLARPRRGWRRPGRRPRRRDAPRRAPRHGVPLSAS